MMLRRVKFAKSLHSVPACHIEDDAVFRMLNVELSSCEMKETLINFKLKSLSGPRVMMSRVSS